MSTKVRKINLNTIDFEVKDDGIVFYGTRSVLYDSQMYEVHVQFKEHSNSWFKAIGKAVIRKMREKIAKISEHISDIQNA